MADRAVAACPGDINALQMRSNAYAHPGNPTISADDWRQALRERRQMIDMLPEGTPLHEETVRTAQLIEAQLRARITADLASLKLAADK